MITSKKQLVSMLKQQLASNDNQATKALMRIYSYQTLAEQNQNSVIEDNGVGFNGTDSEILSSFAKFYASHNFLSPKQMVILKKKIVKYAGQLINQSIEKGLIIKVGNNYIFNQK